MYKIKIGIFIKPGNKRDAVKEIMFRIADKYLNTETTTIVEQKDHIRLSDKENIVELFIVGESVISRGVRLHKIYVDADYSNNFMLEVLFPQATLPNDDPSDERVEYINIFENSYVIGK